MEKGTAKGVINRPFVRSNIRLLEVNLTSKQVGMIRGRWVGRMAGRLVIGRLGRLSVMVGKMARRLVIGEFSVLVARIPQWWLDRRIVGRLMLVGRWVHNLSGRRKWWVVQSLERRLRVRMVLMIVLMMMFTALMLLMDNMSSWCV